MKKKVSVLKNPLILYGSSTQYCALNFGCSVGLNIRWKNEWKNKNKSKCIGNPLKKYFGKKERNA